MTWRFDLHTAVTAEGDGLYRADLTDAWNIGRVPNGGYLAATSCRAALDALGVPDVVNVTTYFLAAATPGPAELRVDVLKRGRTTSFAEVSLVQGGRVAARTMVLAGDLATFRGPEAHRAGPPALPPREACVRLSPDLMPAPALMREVEARLDPATAAFLRGETGAAPELRAWARLADGRPTDVLALPCLADVLPPTTFNLVGPSRWVPTLELTTQVRRRPAPGWLRLQVVTRHVSAGHLEEDGELWDEDGELVALSRQRAMMLPA